MDKIYLYNRYRYSVYLQQIEDTNKYKLVLVDTNYCRCGYNTYPNDIVFVDPDGGPYISIGTQRYTVFINKEEKVYEITVDKIIAEQNENKEEDDFYLIISSLKDVTE